MTDIPHFASPFRVRGGRAVVIEQDSDEDLLQSTATLLRTPVGSRDELPEYGIPDLPFRTDAGEIDQEITAAIRDWEPRAEGEVEVEVRAVGPEDTVVLRTAGGEIELPETGGGEERDPNDPPPNPGGPSPF